MAGPVAGGAAEFEAKLATFVKENRLAGAAAGVVHGDELAWASGVGFADVESRRPAGPDTLYRIASITKTFTGTAIMQLRDAGRLDLDDAAVQWLPELAGSGSPDATGRITIRRLLSHESGLMSEPPGTDFALLQPRYEGVAARNLARATEINAPIGPNQQPKYSNLGYQLLGEIVARASGQDYSAYLQQEVLTPLQMTETGFDPMPDSMAARRATAYTQRTFSDELDVAPDLADGLAEGGLWSTVSDLGRWVSFHLGAHADQPRESSVLGAETLREMHKPRYLSDESWTEAFAISWYAVRKGDVIWVQHSGGLHGFTSNACFDRDQKVGAVVLLNGRIADASVLAMELAGIGRRLVQASPPVISAPEPTPEEYKPLLGLYLLPAMGELRRVEWRDGALVFISPNYAEPMPLRPAGEPDAFVVGLGFRDSGELARFRRTPDGRVTSLYFGSATLLRLAPVDAPAG